MIALVMFSTKSELSAWEIETALSSSSVLARSSLASALWHWNLEMRRLLNRVDVLEHELSVLHFVGVPNTMNSGTPMFLISPMTWVLAPSVFASRAVIEVLACSWLCSLRSFARADPCCWVCSFTRCESALLFLLHVLIPAALFPATSSSQSSSFFASASTMLRLARVEAYDTGALCFRFAFGSVAVLYRCRLAPRTLIDDLLFLDPVCLFHAGAHCSRLSVTFIATLLCELVFARPSRADPRVHVVREPPAPLCWTNQHRTEEDSSSQS